MPIVCNVPLPAEGPSAEEELEEFLEKGSPYGVVTTQREYRFSGYHLVRDVYGNILWNRPHSSQPAFWAYRGIRCANLSMAGP
jgi:hypothetical protein